MKGFCEKKFSSMLISGTFTKAVMYLMLLSDSIIAGYFIGPSGVAGINAITPVTAIVTFFGDLVSTGVGIVFTREVGAMRKDRADEIYGQGLIISVGIGLISALLIFAFQNTYFSVCGVTGDILEKALRYYRLIPINAFLTIVIFYLEQMVYSDGDELCNNICYGFQIGGNVIFSVILTRFMGMTGIILGSVIGNSLGILTCLWHYFRKENTLRFVWHLSFRDFLLSSRYSIVDSSVYICWGLMDYVVIGFVSGRYGESGLITLAVVVSLIEFGVVMDGVDMAMQPLIGTFFGEKNHQLIKRVMRSGVRAAVIEGAAATALIWIFARQFCALFGITGGAALAPSITALRIVSLGFTFCVSPETEHIADEYIDPEGYFTAARLVSMGIAWNTDLVDESAAPRTWNDLLDPTCASLPGCVVCPILNTLCVTVIFPVCCVPADGRIPAWRRTCCFPPF